jgi:hypothetical protein
MFIIQATGLKPFFQLLRQATAFSQPIFIVLEEKFLQLFFDRRLFICLHFAININIADAPSLLAN